MQTIQPEFGFTADTFNLVPAPAPVETVRDWAAEARAEVERKHAAAAAATPALLPGAVKPHLTPAALYRADDLPKCDCCGAPILRAGTCSTCALANASDDWRLDRAANDADEATA